MKTFVGIDYHKGFSYGAIMTESGRIVKHLRPYNKPPRHRVSLDNIGTGGLFFATPLQTYKKWAFTGKISCFII